MNAKYFLRHFPLRKIVKTEYLNKFSIIQSWRNVRGWQGTGLQNAYIWVHFPALCFGCLHFTESCGSGRCTVPLSLLLGPILFILLQSSFVCTGKVKGFLATSMLPMVRNQLTAWIPCWPKTRVQPLHQLIHDNHHISLRSLPASQSSATIEHTSQYQSQSHCQWSCGNVNFHDNLLLQYV